MFFSSFNRILAKHEIQKELKYTRTRANLSYNTMNKTMKNVLEYTSTYGQLNKRKNDLDSYMRGYKRRYSKKSGLGKLDCYYEKKLFDKIEDIDNLIDKLQNDKKLLKKKLFYKFGIPLILFSLIPVIGLIITLVHYGYFSPNFKCFSDCSEPKHSNQHSQTHNAKYPRAPITGNTWKTILSLNFALYCITTFIVVSVFIYIFIKFIKYQRLKACRSKMSIKEYCQFCKEIF